jgi:hypothetical protein
MQSCASTQRQSLARGTTNHVFMEGNQYCCASAQPGRAERGVQSGLYRLKYRFPSKEWDSIHRVLKRVEYAFDRYMDTDIIRHISSCARSWVKFKTIEPSPSLTPKKLARYCNGLGFGINVYLRSHTSIRTLLCLLFKLTLTTMIIKLMIESYVTLLSQEMERLWHFGLVTFYYLIHRNCTPFLLAVNQETKYFAFLLTLNWGLLVSMIIVTPLYNPAIPQILTSKIRILENSIICKSFLFCIFMSICCFECSL